MPREGVAEGLELEAALAGEEAGWLRDAVASMDRFHDMDGDSPQLLATELGGDGSVDLNKDILDGEQQTSEVPIRRPCEDSNERLNRLIATQKRIMENKLNTGGRIIDPLRCSLSTSTVEALICAQSWLHTSKGKPSARETAEEVQMYEEIREEFSLKDCTENQHCIADLIELDT